MPVNGDSVHVLLLRVGTSRRDDSAKDSWLTVQKGRDRSRQCHLDGKFARLQELAAPDRRRPTMVGIVARFQAVAVWLTIALSLYQGAHGGSRVEYLQDVKPILKSRCYACHGALKQEAGLRLDTGRLIRKGGDSGEVIVPGQPERSVLVERISAADLFARIPPERDPLSDAQIAVLKQWIADGAQSPAAEQPEADPGSHWAFQPLVRPPVPRISDVCFANPIDAYLQAQLLQHDVPAIAKADKPVVLRRVTLDLIGLPPTREELNAFLEDESPTAYESVVDRLLNDPRYGERWARHWMDVWRYSDWYGRRHVPDVWNSAGWWGPASKWGMSTARRMNSAITPWERATTSPTCMPLFCICSVSTIAGWKSPDACDWRSTTER